MDVWRILNVRFRKENSLPQKFSSIKSSSKKHRIGTNGIRWRLKNEVTYIFQNYGIIDEPIPKSTTKSIIDIFSFFQSKDNSSRDNVVKMKRLFHGLILINQIRKNHNLDRFFRNLASFFQNVDSFPYTMTKSFSYYYGRVSFLNIDVMDKLFQYCLNDLFEKGKFHCYTKKCKVLCTNVKGSINDKICTFFHFLLMHTSLCAFCTSHWYLFVDWDICPIDNYFVITMVSFPSSIYFLVSFCFFFCIIIVFFFFFDIWKNSLRWNIIFF